MGKKLWTGKGFCRVYYPDREDTLLLAIGRYVNGKKSGLWTWYNEEGEISHTGKYVNGLKEGLWKEIQQGDGSFSAGKFLAGRKQGLWKTYTTDGLLTEKIPFVQGRIHGTVYHYNDERLSSKTQYVEGLLHGQHVTYYENGNINSFTVNVKGKQVSSKDYDYEGTLTRSMVSSGIYSTETVYDDAEKTISHFKNSQLHGWVCRYTKNGKLLSKKHYVNNQLWGSSIEMEGDRKTIATYQGDVLNGPRTRYEKINGQWVLMATDEFLNGELNGKSIGLDTEGNNYCSEYKNGKLHGKEYILSLTGDTLLSAVYIDGIPQGRQLQVTGSEKKLNWFVEGSMVHTKIYKAGLLTFETFFRNRYEYDPAHSQTDSVTGELVEVFYHENGNKKTERFFGPESMDRYRQLEYFPDGKLRREEVAVSHRKQYEIHLDEAGDTLVYEMYDGQGQKQGRSITRESSRPGQAYVFKGWYKNGVCEGKTELYYSDGTNEKKPALMLAATGQVYKNEPFGHWDFYYPDGSKKYGGCVCGWNDWYNGPQSFRRLHEAIEPNSPCGDYVWNYASGKLKEKCQAGQVEGYYEDGTLRIKGQYKGTKMHGTWQFFDISGKEKYRYFYEDGTLINTVYL